MKYKIIQILILVLTINCDIYSLINNKNWKNFSFLKFLLNFLSTDSIDPIEEEVNYVCSKSPNNLIKFYEETSPYYTYTPPVGNKKFALFFNEMLNNIGSDDFVIYAHNYLTQEVVDLLIVALFFILLFILWIFYIFIICYKCCGCFPRSFSKYKKFFLKIGLILCGIIVIISMATYFENIKISKGIFGSGCTIFKVIHHAFNGDDYTKQKPYWPGLKFAINSLSKTKDNITSLIKTATEFRKQYEELEEIAFCFSDEIYEEYNYRVKCKLYNPIPEYEDFYPEYIEYYGPPYKENTTLNIIENQITNKYYGLINQLIKYILDIINLDYKSVSVIENLDEGIKKLQNIYDNIDEKIFDFIKGVQKWFEKIHFYSILFLSLLTSFNLLLLICVGFCFIILIIYKRGKDLLVIISNFLYFFMLLLFLLGCLFIILGLFIQDISWGLSTFIHNITKVDDTNDIILFADYCFNGEGYLPNIFPDSFNTTVVDLIYSLENIILSYIDDIKDYEFDSIENADEFYDDIKSKPKKYVPELFEALNNIRSFIDLSVENSSVSDATPIYDEWEINKVDCKYNYLFENNNLNEEEKKCIIITEWDIEQLLKRYENILLIDPEKNINEQVKKYYYSIMNFIKSNNKFISEIKEKKKNLKDSAKNLGKQSINILNSVLKIVRPFRQFYSEIVGDGSIFEILNCNFLKRDINVIFKELSNNFGKHFKITGSLLLVISILEFFITVLIVFILGKKRKIEIKRKKIKVEYEFLEK